MKGSALELYVAVAYGGLTCIFNRKFWVNSNVRFSGCSRCTLTTISVTWTNDLPGNRTVLDTARMHPTGWLSVWHSTTSCYRHCWIISSSVWSRRKGRWRTHSWTVDYVTNSEIFLPYSGLPVCSLYFPVSDRNAGSSLKYGWPCLSPPGWVLECSVS